MRQLSAGRRRKPEPARPVERPLDLLLDEPTNHMAPAVVEELGAASPTSAAA
ncbi:hypothetical protein [Streptomyces avidinii]|uniref:hypothetical protein n=1 Tax=Streptomyces avidinii TaxID=1895 RepID=UPI003869AB05